ncbi:MAG TPA: hypothetical protein VJR95_02220 [Rhodanobacter sp.]|nr:hypothetical protein [Rhodanobacter sp.]
MSISGGHVRHFHEGRRSGSGEETGNACDGGENGRIRADPDAGDRPEMRTDPREALWPLSKSPAAVLPVHGLGQQGGKANPGGTGRAIPVECACGMTSVIVDG